MVELKLTEKQRAFCREYLASGDVQKAARLAGYAKGQKGWFGRRVLASPAVQRELARLRWEQRRQNELNGLTAEAVAAEEWADGAKNKAAGAAVAKREEILQFLTGVMRGELRDEREVLANGQVRVVTEGPKLSERTRAAELLGKSKRMFSEKTKESGKRCVVKIIGENDLPE